MTQIERLNASLSGHYHIERQLGQGGMATVYLAEDLRHDRKVAIKDPSQPPGTGVAARLANHDHS